MMQRNPRAFLRAAATVLRPTAAAVPRALQTITPQVTPPTGLPLFLAHGRARAFATTSTYHRNDDVDIKELQGAYCYIFDVPGFRARDLTVEMTPYRFIKVTGERCEEDETGACRYLRKERSIGKLEHMFGILHDADTGRMSAVCRDGVLTVTIQKLPSPPGPLGFPRIIQIDS